MSNFDEIKTYAHILNMDGYTDSLAKYAYENSLSEHDLDVITDVFKHLSKLKKETVVSTLLKMSRLPLNNPKTFENFEFNRLSGTDIDKLNALSSLSALYAHKNISFIGPQGVGKTHLAMAFARACCEQGMKSYFLKASELDQRFSEARKYNRVGTVVDYLVKPSCLVIDEIGRCTFDKENTRLFFDLIDRRYSKDGANNTIFTSNKQPDVWNEFFTEDSSLLCALDRIFDDASVFIIKGESYRGKKLETIKLEAGTALLQAQTK